MVGGSGVLCGPEDDSDIPKESMGKYFFDCLRKRDPGQVININAITKEVLTCGQLLEDSVKLAAILKSLSLGKDDVIALVSENSINYFTPILAALYIGIIVNPLNPTYTAGELKHALLISKAKVILCSVAALETVLKVTQELEFVESVMLMEPSSNHIGIGSIRELLTQTATNVGYFKPSTLDYSEQGALIMLSSGTTGLPKGVLLTHQNLRAAAVYMTHPNYGGVSSSHTTLLIVPFFHIYGIMIETAAIIASMQVVVMEKFKPELFLKCIEKHQATKLFLVPPILNFFANSPLVDNYNTSSVQDIVCGTAPIGQYLIDKAAKRIGNPAIRQAYGLTEVTGACIFHSPNDIREGSVGMLVPGALAKVQKLDSCGTAGPLTNGELCFKGPMLMKGYLGNTDEVNSSVDKEGFYHSGDVGYYDESQNFYLVDRLKELIKYKGYQVAPAELEALLLSHPEIVDCGVIGVPDERAGELPFAFVVQQSSSKLTEKDVVRFVAERISLHKQLHGGVRFVDTIPKTASGKVLRRILIETFKRTN